MAKSPLIAVVLGGSDRADPLAREAGVTAKALVPLSGKPMASYVLAALRGSASVSEYIYVGKTTPDLDTLVTQTLDPGEKLSGQPQHRTQCGSEITTGTCSRYLR